MVDLFADEPVDRVWGRADVTEWRRRARRHQSAWREEHGWPAGRQRRSQQGGGYRPIGSRLDPDFAREPDANFLTDGARDAVRYRLDHPRQHQTLDEERLHSDLLSSMPMCFNLLGPLWADPDLATTVTHRWFPDLCPADAHVSVELEWSPGRRDDAYLGDRTAFDAALWIRVGAAHRLVGIETKYHEHAPAEAVVRRRKGVEHRPAPNQRYVDVTERAELFARANWLEDIWGTPLEQVWRDHLLVLACAQHEGGPTQVRSVLVAPAANPIWAEVCETYNALLRPAARATFAYRTLDDLVDSAADLLPHADDFTARYLAVP